MNTSSMHGLHQFTFTVSKSIADKFLAQCVAERVKPVDRFRELVIASIEAASGIAELPKLKLRGLPKTVLGTLKPDVPVTISGISTSMGAAYPTIKYAFQTLIGHQLIESAGPVPTGSRYAESYKLTALGQLTQLDLEATAEPVPLAEQRAAVKVMLINAGWPPEEAELALADEEGAAYIGEYKPDYSKKYWAECIAIRAENMAAESENPE